MLIVSRKNRDTIQDVLARAFQAERLIDHIVLDGIKPTIVTQGWREFWEPCIRFAAEDTRLLHRLNRLKAAWRTLLRSRACHHIIARYCWRYFGLLHHTIRIGIQKGESDTLLAVVRRIVAFETFTAELPGQDAHAGAVVCHRNPIYLLGRLPQAVCHPTPRHVPLVMPDGAQAPFYHYRQHTFSGHPAKVLLFPSVDLGQRQQSFAAIDRFARLTCNRQDPFADSRAKVLSKRVLVPLTRAIRATGSKQEMEHSWRMLDLGTGTGHLIGQICLRIRRTLSIPRNVPLEICCVDSSEPSSGRTYGLSGDTRGISSIEWIAADYRRLLDDDSWLQQKAWFQIVTLCRLFDNMSLFSFETASAMGPEFQSRAQRSCLPHQCLSPRLFPSGINNLQVGTTKRATSSGKSMPQLSLGEFFTAMKAVWLNDPRPLGRDEWSLPCRRFNPASLITRSGRSVIGQLLKRATAIVIEDLDLSPEDLRLHVQQFGIPNVAAVQFIHDGFSTQAYHYAIASPQVVARLKGTRLW